MADSFPRIVGLPPLRVTVQELVKRIEELAAQMNSGGKVNVTYEVSFEDGTSFTRDSSSDFLQNIDSEGDHLSHVEVGINAWTSPPSGNEWGGEIAKSVRLRLRHFGSEAYVASTDPIWGGAPLTRLKRDSVDTARGTRACTLGFQPYVAYSLRFRSS